MEILNYFLRNANRVITLKGGTKTVSECFIMRLAIWDIPGIIISPDFGENLIL